MTYKKALVLLIAGMLVIQCLTACGKSDSVSDTTVTEAPNPPEVPDGTKPGSPDKNADKTVKPTEAVTTPAVQEKTISADAEKFLNMARNDFHGIKYVQIYSDAYKRMVEGTYDKSTEKTVKTPLKPSEETITPLNISVLYKLLRITYTLDKPYNAADGNVYTKGMLLPTWKQLETDLDISINDATLAEAKDFTENYNYHLEKEFKDVDVLAVNIKSADEKGQAGYFVPLDLYFNYLPNLKSFLDRNQIIKNTITAGDGHIYYAPYFDGYNDIEKTFLCRIDWVKKLLDGEYDAEKFDKTPYTDSMTYTAYMPESAADEQAISVKAVKEKGNGVETVTKNYKKNITTILKELPEKNGATLVKAFRDYIDETYGGYYGENRSNLFVGQNAAWDADEFVALLRCVVANPSYLTNGQNNKVYAIFPRETGLQRNMDLIIMASDMFGVRGSDSRKGTLYFDAKGELHDGRCEKDFYYVLEKLNSLYNDGLIIKDFDTEGTEGISGKKINTYMFNNNAGFCMYDYVQTQTAFNDTVSVEGFDFESIINPIAYWYSDLDENGDITGKYMRFTESWRSVKTEGWLITEECANDPAKFYKALQLVDYLYSEEGNTLMSYGPKAWIQHDKNGKNEYITYQDAEVPKLSDAALAELKTLTGGNYTDYYRTYLGATLPCGYIKQQGMEYQCTTEKGKAGLERINNAILYGVIEHVQMNDYDCRTPFYLISPTEYATSSSDDMLLKDCENLQKYFLKTSEDTIFLKAIKEGFSAISIDLTEE